MKIKKIVLLFLAFLLLLCTKSFAAEEYVSVNLNDIVSQFNNNEFVTKLSSPSKRIYAVERTNRYTLRMGNNLELTYVYEEDDLMLHTEIDVSSPNKEDLLLLNALMVDTIAKMQGDTSSKVVSAALSETYFSTDAEFDGVEQYFLSKDDGSKVIVCNICPYIKITLPDYNSGIPKNEFSSKYDTIYDDANTFIYYEDMVALKYTDDNGKTVVYVGEADQNTNRSKESVKNLLELLSTEKAISYFDKSVNDLNNNFKIEGIELETNIDSLPLTETRVLLLPNNMKYVKFTLDLETMKKKGEEIPTSPVAGVGDPVSLSTISFPLVTAVIVIGVVFLIILIGIIKRNSDK